MNRRTILHVDMDAFYASVEQRDNPALRGKAVIVGAGGDERGVVCAASYEAREFGVHSAMPSRTASKLCPHGIFIYPNMSKYREASRRIMAILSDFTPLVEQLSVDEAFLDVTGSQRQFGDGVAIARQIKSEIKSQTDLTASVGVASNKFLAKLASAFQKPDGLTAISEESKTEFLAPLPVSRIWGVGRATEKLFREIGIHTIGELQRHSLQELRIQFGNSASHLRALAFGEDDRAVEPDGEAKSVGSEHTFAADTANRDQIKSCLLEQCEEVGSRLRSQKIAARTVQLKLRYSDFTTLTRRRTLACPTQDEMTLYEIARQLLAAEKLGKKRVRLIGVSGTNLVAPEVQTDLFERPDEKRQRLAKAVDELRGKLGAGAITRGSLLR